MDLSSYHSVIYTFIQWCDKNCLVLNVKKTQEMVFDPRSVSEQQPVISRHSDTASDILQIFGVLYGQCSLSEDTS